MKWLDGAIKDNRTGMYSSSRLGALIATIAMSLSIILLSIAAMWTDKDVAMALGAVAVPLAGLNGYSYGRNKAAAVMMNSPAASGADQVSANHAAGISKEQ